MGLKSLTPYRPNYNQSGAGRDRTDDLVNAIHALSQLSYSPIQLSKKRAKFNHFQIYFKYCSEKREEDLLILKLFRI